jgi:hypothetical protein
MRQTHIRLENRSRIVAFLSVMLGLLFVGLYLGYVSPSKWTFLIVISYLAYFPYLLFDSFFSGLWIVIGLNVLAYMFIPRLGYVTTFTFISLYVPIRYLLGKLPSLFSWVFKYIYFNVAFFSWLFVQSKVLRIDILSQTAEGIAKIVQLDKDLIIYGIIIFGNIFFAAYEYLFERVVQKMNRWVEKIVGK